MTASRTQTDAQTLLKQHAAKVRFAAAPPPSATTLSAAYDVQDAFVALMLAREGPVAGYKIGLTSPRMQAMCGIDQPISGVVLAQRVRSSGATLSRRAYGRLGLEFEIAMRVGRDATGGGHSAHSVRAHVDAVCAGIEIVDDRNADYKTLDVRGLVADNSWNEGMVLSQWMSAWPDLGAAEGVVHANGQAVDRGFGRDVLGDPFVALAWLANHLRARGERLRAGQVVMTGSLVPTRFPLEDTAFRYELAGIGSVSVKVVA
ncbi:MAG TPA: fumarylacetoacetate hydrolase family protein [Burkholderiaceae bacterium]|nr:fumarylacetoacetate hydrolase family protein [Burkholderiaceae bacterium]